MGDYINMARRNKKAQKEAFIKRNEKLLKKLKKMANNDNVTTIIMSPELAYHLSESTKNVNVKEHECRGGYIEYFYRHKSKLPNRVEFGTRIITDAFQPAGKVSFIYREHPDNLRFEVPCVCGFFNDEDHDFKLK